MGGICNMFNNKDENIKERVVRIGIEIHDPLVQRSRPLASSLSLRTLFEEKGSAGLSYTPTGKLQQAEAHGPSASEPTASWECPLREELHFGCRSLMGGPTAPQARLSGASHSPSFLLLAPLLSSP